MNTLGTILYLKGGTQKVMIIGRNAILKLNDEEYLYDYVGCRYPSGFSMKGMIYFNEENIDSILFLGYSDEEEVRMLEVFKEWKDKEESKYRRKILK
ncbi:MAG: DUF4176 domain-containing protein [Thomasclavelia sp.]|uniref:DUF4176 domain-containing protein n=1 Tax=Thomasclavelia sp. TaxID=3025757 RepID=UPI00399EED93